MPRIRYIAGDSFLHRLDPRVKFILVIMATLLIFIVSNYIVLTLAFLSTLLVWKLASIPLNIISGYLKLLAGLFIIIIILQAMFYNGTTILLEPLLPAFVPILGGLGNITLEGILFGLLLSLRVLTLVCLLPLFIYTTSLENMILGLVKLGLPYKIAFIVTTALNQMPILQEEIEEIINAQTLRGFTVFESGNFLEKLKAYPTLVLPLVFGAMRRSQLMGVAMDSRAFGVSKERTFITEIRMKSLDWLILVTGFCYLTFLLLLNFI